MSLLVSSGPQPACCAMTWQAPVLSQDVVSRLAACHATIIIPRRGVESAAPDDALSVIVAACSPASHGDGVAGRACWRRMRLHGRPSTAPALAEPLSPALSASSSVAFAPAGAGSQLFSGRRA